MLTIGEKIRYFRDIKGYSQEYMAQKLGISTKTYNSLETEKTKVSIERVQKIAELLEIDWLELLSYREKITQVNGDNSNNSNHLSIYHSDKDLAHENEKLRLQLAHQAEKIADLLAKVAYLEKINALLEQQK
ncbi:MAG: helix-turn-helix domain-containing protein [Thermoflexibacteraceae bacterium]